MRFEKGNTYATGGKRPGAGRKPTEKTVIKRFKEKYPEAYDVLMEMLYKKGKAGNTEAAQYVINREKGSPRQSIDQRIRGTVELSAVQRQVAIDEAQEYERSILDTQDIKQIDNKKNPGD